MGTAGKWCSMSLPPIAWWYGFVPRIRPNMIWSLTKEQIVGCHFLWFLSLSRLEPQPPPASGRWFGSVLNPVQPYQILVPLIRIYNPLLHRVAHMSLLQAQLLTRSASLSAGLRVLTCSVCCTPVLPQSFLPWPHRGSSSTFSFLNDPGRSSQFPATNSSLNQSRLKVHLIGK